MAAEGERGIAEGGGEATVMAEEGAEKVTAGEEQETAVSRSLLATCERGATK